MRTSLIHSVLFAVASLSPPETLTADDPEGAARTSELVVRLYVDDSKLSDGQNLGAVVEVHNGTEEAFPLSPLVELSREPKERTLPDGIARAEELPDPPAPPVDPRLLWLTIVSSVHEGSTETSSDQRVRGRRVNKTIAPGETVFLALELPGYLFAPGNCALSAKLERQDATVAEAGPIVIRCVGCKEAQLIVE